MDIVRIGLDLAKTVFQVHGVGSDDHTILRKTLRRDAVVPFFAQLPPCLVGMEACSGSHFWARMLTELGHEVRLISPQFVAPYVKSNKNDCNDAEAICETVGRPSMRFVPQKITGATGDTIRPPHPAEVDLGPDAACEPDSRLAGRTWLCDRSRHQPPAPGPTADRGWAPQSRRRAGYDARTRDQNPGRVG